MNTNSHYTKKGVFTSRENGEPGQVPQRRQYAEAQKNVIFSHYEQTRPEVIVNKPHITIEELNQNKYANSQGYNNIQRQEINFVHQNAAQSHFIPPPPQRFLVSSGHNYSNGSKGQHSQLPINSNHLNHMQGQYIIQPGTIVTGMPMQTIQTVPIYQNIKKTYIPHHIYNEIPIMNSQTKHYVESQYQDIKEAENNDEEQINDADEKMMQEYEKLYQTYLEEKSKSERLERRLIQVQQEFRNRGNRNEDPPQALTQDIVHTKEVYVNRPVKIDQKLLLSLIMKKLRPSMNEFFDRKKSSCLNKLRNLLTQHQSSLKTTISRSSQEITIVRLKSN